MAEQIAYYFPTPLPTLPPNCFLHEQPVIHSNIVSWCTFPTPTAIQMHTFQTLPSYLQFTSGQENALLKSLPLDFFLLAIVSFTLLVLYFCSRLLLIKQQCKEEHVLLSVIPTNVTVQSPLETEQLFIQLSSLVSQKTLWQQLQLDRYPIK